MPPRFHDLIVDRPPEPRRGPERPVLGVLPGEGVGPEVIGASLRVLSALESATGRAFDIRTGGAIGWEAESIHGRPLSDEVIGFCREIFDAGGAILAGPGGGRFVYDTRRHFDLFCKVSPLRSYDELSDVCRLKSEFASGVDLVVIRENMAGVYQGEHSEEHDEVDGRTVHQRFSYSERQVRRIVRVGARIARARRGRLVVVFKEGGLRKMSELWRDSSAGIIREHGVDCTFLDIDYAAFRLVQHAQEFDVVVAPNMLGDILSDLGSVVTGSRALSYGASFNSRGHGVYQTNHGSAHDIAGSDRANPVGQILSLAMMLRESYALDEEAGIIERAVRAVWREGWRTDDLVTDGSRALGTRAMAERIAEVVATAGERAPVR